MNLPAAADPVPLVAAEEGRVIRVAGTRVTLDTVVTAFKRGATPEEIAQDYSSVPLPDIYAVITYYLRHREEIEEYLERRALDHEELRQEIESRPGYQELRERLLARMARARAGRHCGCAGHHRVQLYARDTGVGSHSRPRH